MWDVCRPPPRGELSRGGLQVLLDDEARLPGIDHSHRPPVALTRFLEFTSDLQPRALRQHDDRSAVRRGTFPKVQLRGCPNYRANFIDR